MIFLSKKYPNKQVNSTPVNGNNTAQSNLQNPHNKGNQSNAANIRKSPTPANKKTANLPKNIAPQNSNTNKQTNNSPIIIDPIIDPPAFESWIYAALFVAAAILIASVWFIKKFLANGGNSSASLKNAVSAKEELANSWLKKRKSKNIHAIGVGKIEGTENYCIQVFVEDADGQMLEDPPTHLLPKEYRNFPIVIYKMQRARFLGFTVDLSENYGSKAREPHEMIVGGISGANTNLSGETGTIGYFCSPTILHPIRKFRKEVYLLSNAHVFADLSKTEKPGNDLIQQPSPGENKRHDFIASLEKFVPIKFDNDTEDPNFTDAAIAKLFPGKTHKLEIPHIGKILDFVPREKIELRTNCRKFGRTTGYTEGQIFSIHLSIWIKYGATNRESFFKEQFLIVPTAPHDDFVRGGDSGSLVADHENKALGLIFAGAASNTNFGLENLPTDLEDLIPNNEKKIRSFGVANPISEVMKSLNVKLMI